MVWDFCVGVHTKGFAGSVLGLRNSLGKGECGADLCGAGDREEEQAGVSL